MRIRPQQLRVLAAIAMQRVSEHDLRVLHEIVQELSPVLFIELIRDLEDEIENTLSLVFENTTERSFGMRDFVSGISSELDLIRRKDLKLPVSKFAELMIEALAESPSIDRGSIPAFDSRRGLQVWINRLLKSYSDQEIYQAVKLVRSWSGRNDSEPVWKLR